MTIEFHVVLKSRQSHLDLLMRWKLFYMQLQTSNLIKHVYRVYMLQILNEFWIESDWA